MKKLMNAWELMGKLRGKEPSALEDNKPMKGSYDGDARVRFGQVTGTAGRGVETIGDDAPLAAAARDAISRDEALVREALGLAGMDYDALIAMDGVSPYSQAVAANPALIQDILKDEMPVLAAVKVAMGYKPYADFAGKYGKEPGEIREKIKAEVLAEMKGDPVEAAPVVKAAVGPLFSARYGKAAVGKAAKGDLASLFKK